MLVLKRYDGEWIEVEHVDSGDLIRIRVYDIKAGRKRQASLAFDDKPRKFNIYRPERQDTPTLENVAVSA